MRRAGSVLFAAISLALHLVWVVWMPEAAPTLQAATHWVEVSYESAPSAPAPVSAVEEAPAEDVVEPPPEPARSRETPKPRAQQKPVELTPRTEAAEPAEAPPVGEQPPKRAAADTRPVAKPLAILPRTAALSLDGFDQGSALHCGDRAPEGDRDCPPGQQDTGQAAQETLTRELNAAAHRVAHLKARERPTLKPRPDGSYTYEGHAFQAVVRPDGNVAFRDTAIQGELRVSLVPFVFNADLNDVVERHVLGRELYSAEKQWLLDETRALRDQLASEFRRREQQGANRELERMLQRVLDDNALTITKKHEAIFLLWQDCGEDAQAHRQAVVRFVRRYLPRGSALGFHADELDQLNAGRGRLQRFEPYGS